MIFLDEEKNALIKGAEYILTKAVDVAEPGQVLKLVYINNASVGFWGKAKSEQPEELWGAVAVDFKVDNIEDTSGPPQDHDHLEHLIPVRRMICKTCDA